MLHLLHQSHNLVRTIQNYIKEKTLYHTNSQVAAKSYDSVSACILVLCLLRAAECVCDFPRPFNKILVPTLPPEKKILVVLRGKAAGV
jgi:hypothetical protein